MKRDSASSSVPLGSFDRTLANYNACLHAVLQSALDCVMIIDPDGKVIEWNPAAERTFGYTRNEMVGVTLIDKIVPAEQREIYSRAFSEYVRTKQSELIERRLETTAVRRSGQVFPIEVTLVPIEIDRRPLFVAYARDISEKKNADAARAQLAAIVEASDDAILALDLQGRITAWNEGATKMYGYSAEEMCGRSIAILIPPDAVNQDYDVLLQLERGRSLRNYQTSRIRKDNKRIHVSLTLSPMRDGKGNVIGSAHISRDISHQIIAEFELEQHRNHLESLVRERTEALVQSQDRLRQSERLASVGALAAGIAHEINNPVGAMMLCAENARHAAKNLKTVEEHRRLLENATTKIIGNAKRCGLIVKGILQFARNKSTHKEPGDINQLALNALRLLRESVNVTRAQIRTELEPDLPPVNINPIEIEQVFFNLLKNAVESTADPITIIVRTVSAQTTVLIDVEDNGPGMSEEQRRHLFDPFYTTRQQEGGTGLGMSIVHGIVESHDGKVAVESVQGTGTKISIALPISRQQELAPGNVSVIAQ
ncbi:MAG: PAS domain S-box protein [Bdellovibrionota bacterium]